MFNSNISSKKCYQIRTRSSSILISWTSIQKFMSQDKSINAKITFKIQNQPRMQDDKVRNLYAQLLTTPTAALQAHATLKNTLLSDPSLLSQTLQYLSNPEQSNPQQQKQHFHTVVLLHPVLIDLFSQLNADLQDEIRSGLLSIVVAQHANLNTVGALALLARQIIEMDGAEPWVQPLGELMKWSSSQELPAMLAGIEFFISLFRETAYTKSNSEAGMYKFASILLQKLFAVFANPQLGEHGRVKLLCLVLQIVKSFSPLDGVQDNIVKSCFDGTFQLWMSLFISALQGSLNLNLSIKKYILKILIVIYRDMQRYLALRKYHQPGHIFTVWEFTYRLLPLYLWGHVWDQKSTQFPPQPRKDQNYKEEDYLAYDDDSDALCSTLQGLAQSSLQFLSVLISIPHLQGALRVSVHHLTNALFHYALISNEECDGWKTNPHHFSAQTNTMEYEAGVRGKCLSILNEMIEKFGDLAIQAILVASQKFLLNLPQESSLNTFNMVLKVIAEDSIVSITGGFFESQAHFMNLAKLSGVDIRSDLNVSGQTWRKVEAGLLVLARFSQDVIVFQSKQTGAFDIESFVRGIVRQIRQQDYYSLLKGQSLYCLTRFTEIISIKFRSLFPQLVAAAFCSNLEGAPLSLRTMACKATCAFLKKVEKHKLQLGSQIVTLALELQSIERICELPLIPEITQTIIESLIQISKNKQLKSLNKPPAAYFLALFHQCLSQQTLTQHFIGLLQIITQDYRIFSDLAQVFTTFAQECLKVYSRELKSEHKRLLKSADTELVLTALRVASVFVEKSNTHIESSTQKEGILKILPFAVDILESNQDVPLQVTLSIFIKSVIRSSQSIIKNRKELVELITQVVKILLRIPKDKSQESGSIYAGNLAILLFDKILGKNHNQILQEIVLKVFRSRTPSVIQSLVLVYARLINQGVTVQNKFEITGQAQTRAKSVVDFLSSFSIENRMGLKILIDKWLLQQSLFRGKYTKVATFMALSRLFLLNDKRVDNLLVIGFNPSHTNVNNDVNAPLKILATLIRCLDNQLSGSKGNQDDQQDEDIKMQLKQEGLTVQLQKFKEEEQQQREQQLRVGGGLADRENQQGSTCYMSAMLQFYDDGEECDDKTEEDLIFLKDSSINFSLGEYLVEFFKFVVQKRGDYFRQCVKGLLKQDVRMLQKYVKF